MPMLVVIIGLFGLSLTMFGLSRGRKSVVNLDERLASFADRPVSLEDQELSEPFSQRVLKPLIKGWTLKLGAMSPAKSGEKIRVKLAQAGNPSGMGVTEFLGLRLLLAIAF